MPHKDPTKKKEYMKQWREKNKDKILGYNKSERVKLYKYNYNRTPKMMEYRKKYNEEKGSFYRDARKLRRDACYLALGGKCSECGFSDYRALQVDHINSDGHLERHLLRRNDYYPNVMESYMKGEGRYQLLCCNCNWIKRVEKGEYRKISH